MAIAPYDQSALPARRPLVTLDSAPPSPPLRKRPGDDTNSLLGGPNVNPAGGASLATPTGRLLAAIAMFMEAVNQCDSTAPGLLDTLPPLPLKQQIALLMDKGPEIAQQMMQSAGFGGMLGAIGAAGGPGAAMGQAAAIPPGGMGMGGGPPMGGMGGM